MPAKLKATAHGYPDYEMRETAQQTKERRASVPLLAARFRPAVGAFALESQSASSVSALDEDFSWRAEGAFIGINSAKGEGSNSFFLHAPFWLPKEWDMALHHRKSGLFLNQGYPLTLEEEI